MSHDFQPGDITQFVASPSHVAVVTGYGNQWGPQVQVFKRTAVGWRKQYAYGVFAANALRLAERGDLSDEIYTLAMRCALVPVDNDTAHQYT